MAKILESVQVAVGKLRSDLRSKHVKVTELGLDIRRAPLRSDGGLVLVADNEEGFGSKITKIVSNRRGQHHVDNLSLVRDELLALGAVIDVDKHVYPGVVGALPLADIVDLLLVTLDGLVGLSTLRLVAVVNCNVRHTLLDVIFKADRVHENKFLNHVGVLQTESDREHAAKRVTNQSNLLDSQSREESLRVFGKLVGAELVARRLAALAEANLIRGDDAVAHASQDINRLTPGRTTKVLAVKNDSGFAVGCARGWDVHKGHFQILELVVEAEEFDGMRVGKVGAVEFLVKGAVINSAVGLRRNEAGAKKTRGHKAGKRETHGSCKVAYANLLTAGKKQHGKDARCWTNTRRLTELCLMLEVRSLAI